MTKVTIVSGYSLEKVYQEGLEYFRKEYHQYQTSLTGKPVGAAERERISHYDSMARGAAGDAGRPFNPGKDVY